ncbi:dapper -like protein [Labeo rohita]|uniref:Dapper-like protein n=1 Tax=Labeo rohita TaxID=84645 RepID=A0A498MPA2_LABRO|nr:dapper -like protein [Labeo rohita]
MYRLFSLAAAERSRQKQRLELSLAGICELELLKRRHEALIASALALHAPEPEPERAERPSDDTNPRCPPDGSWSLMNILQHQVGELKVDADAGSVEPPTDAGDGRIGSGFSEQAEGPSPLGSSDFSGHAEILPVRLAERPKSVGDVFVGRELNGVVRAVPRSLSAPYPPLEGIAEGVAEDEPWIWHPSEDAEEEEPSADDYRQVQRAETYILGLIQRRSPPARPTKPRTSLGPEARAVVRQSSLCRKEERHVWDEPCSIRYPRPALAGIRSASLDFPCGALDPSSSEAESPQHFYQHNRSPSSDELVNAQYIPAQPCRAPSTAHRTHAAPKQTSAQPKAAAKKCRFTEDKTTPKKPGRKACRAQSENSLLGQRERKYNTVERDAVRSAQPKTRRGSAHRRWRSTLELSQDEAETPPEQPSRRSRKPRVYAQPPAPHLHHHHHQPHLRAEYPPDGYAHPVAGESESSLSEAETPGSSSLSSDSDESGGLVWPQQLRPQLAPPSPSHPPGHTLQPKAFVKIKASHALKKKILRFRSGSLKVMTTV